MNLLIGALTLGLTLAILALGVHVSFGTFNIPDITAKGSITLGGAVAAALIVNGAILDQSTRHRSTVTHSMQQAVHLGDRIVMMYRGQVLQDRSDTAGGRVTAEDLLLRSADLRRKEQLGNSLHSLLPDATGTDESVAIFKALSTEEEDIVMDEISPMIMGYVTQSGDLGLHEVVIVPQTDAQKASIAQLLPGAEPKVMRGGTVYSVGRFFSPTYADVVCDKHVDLGLFTTRLSSTKSEVQS